MNLDPVKILGLEFFPGTAQDAIQQILKGGLLTAPAAPGLAHNLSEDPEYRSALLRSRILLPDSGLMVLLWNNLLPDGGKPIQRLSGLEFLQKFLLAPEAQAYLRDSFWVMPNEDESRLNQTWLKENTGIELPPDSIYIAPEYPRSGPIQDPSLLKILQQVPHKAILNNIGGGTQERLGHYLQQHLSPIPPILCCGAAIAFLAGGQTSIPPWADKLKLGWLLRCLSKPGSYVPRYWKAKAIVPLLFKHRQNLPPLASSSA